MTLGKLHGSKIVRGIDVTMEEIRLPERELPEEKLKSVVYRAKTE